MEDKWEEMVLRLGRARSSGRLGLGVGGEASFENSCKGLAGVLMGERDTAFKAEKCK